MNQVLTIAAICIAIVLLLPFLIFLFSKMQMMGWLAALKTHIDYERKTKDEKAKTE
jgi:hypothetical protein